METEGLQHLVDRLADRLHRSVAIDDRVLHPLVASRHFGDEDRVRVQSVLGRAVDRGIAAKLMALGIEHAQAPQRIPAMPELELKARICFPIRYAGLLLGFLWLIDDERLKPDHLVETEETVDAAALVMYRRDIVLEQRQARLETMLRDLVSTDPALRKRAETDLLEEGVLGEHTHVTVMVGYVPLKDGTSDPTIQHERVETALARAGRHSRHTHADGSVLSFGGRHRLVLLFTGRTPWPDTAVTAVASTAVTSVSTEVGARMVAGIGAPCTRASEAHRSYEQALVGVRAAESLPGLGNVVLWESLGVYGLLANLAPRELSATGYPTALTKLAHARNGQTLLATAETFLDCAGDVQRAAEALHIHRTTLYQRIARIEEVSGLSLSEGLDRLTLHLGIKLARLTGSQEFFHA